MIKLIAAFTAMLIIAPMAFHQQAPAHNAAPAASPKPPISSGTITMSTVSLTSDAVATFQGPTLVNGYDRYIVEVRPGWICVISSNEKSSGNILRYNPPTLITLTCVAGEAPKVEPKK